MAIVRSGGGITSKNLVHKPIREGSPRKGVHVPGVNQLGAHVGDKGTNRPHSTGYRGEPLFGAPAFQSELGNSVAARTVCGPGGSREVMRTGSQGTHGEVNRGNPAPVGEIFPGFKK